MGSVLDVYVLNVDDDCQFVEHPNIHGKTLHVAHTWAVSLLVMNNEKTQTEKKMRWMMVHKS